MPYSSNAELPANVKKLPKKKQDQWRHVFNSAMASGKSESTAFAMANGVVKKSMSEVYEEWVRLERQKTLFQRLKGVVIGEPAHPFTLFEKNGTLRFFCWYSNCFKDRDGEILTSQAHKEYADWVADSKEYPELWLWHTQGTKIGQADWIDFDGAFACASGTIDPGMENIAYKVMEDDPGISHGFLAPYEKPGGIVDWYRTFEISALPVEKASNPITGINLLKDGDVSFTPERRAYLIKMGLTEEAVAAMESNSESLQKQLKDLGLEYKGEADPTESEGISTEDVKTILTSMAALTDAVSGLAGVVNTQASEIKELKSVDEDKIHKAFEAEIAKVGGGFRASNDKSTETDPTNDEKTAKDVDWFTNGVIGGALEALSGANK